MKNSKNKVLAAAVCGVIIGSIGTSILGDFDVKEERAENNESIDLAQSNGENINKDKVDKNSNKQINEEFKENNDEKLEEKITEEINSNLISESDEVLEKVNDTNNNNININTGNGDSYNNGTVNEVVNEESLNIQGSNDDNFIDIPKDEPVIETPTTPAEPVLKYYDGTYTATATGYDTGLEVKVSIFYDQIASIVIVNHNETIGICDQAIDLIPYRIMASQSTDVDVVSGATYTSNGIINAVNAALSQARR